MKRILSFATILFLFATTTKAQEGSLTLVKTFDDAEINLEDYCMKTPLLSVYESQNDAPISEVEEPTKNRKSLRLSSENELKLYDADLNLHKTINFGNIYPEAYRVQQIEDDALGDKRFYVTQTLFNDDDLIEFVVVGDNFFAIINENGKVLLRDEVDPNYSDFFVKKLGNKIYFQVEDYGHKQNSRLYLIDKSATNSIENNTIISKMSIYPNPAQEYIYVPYNLQGAKRGTITITSLQGEELITASVNDNRSTLRLSTNKLSSGLYIVTVSDGSKILNSEKVLVK